MSLRYDCTFAWAADYGSCGTTVSTGEMAVCASDCGSNPSCRFTPTRDNAQAAMVAASAAIPAAMRNAARIPDARPSVEASEVSDEATVASTASPIAEPTCWDML